MLTSWQRKAKQLLTDARGRAALGEFGINVELVDNGNHVTESTKSIVAILCPAYRTPDARMKDSLMQMVEKTRQHGVTVYAAGSIQSSVVHWTRNRLLGELLKSGKPWTHVLYIDDDMVVDPDDLLRLLSHKQDIVAGLCTRRQDPPLPNALLWNGETKKYDRIWEWEQGTLLKGKIAGGTGLMLISRHATEQVAQAYFDCLWEIDNYGLSGEKLETIKAHRLKAFDDEKICYWFRFLGTAQEMGEDVSFCHIAIHYCGLDVCVDTNVLPGHLGLYPFSIRDFLPYQQQCIEAAIAEGKYKPKKMIGEYPETPSFVITHEEPELVTQ